MTTLKVGDRVELLGIGKSLIYSLNIPRFGDITKIENNVPYLNSKWAVTDNKTDCDSEWGIWVQKVEE